MSDKEKPKRKLIVDNRRARYEYHILDTFEAGIVLVGTEVKSLRAGKVTMKDAFVTIRNGEPWLHNLHISPFEKGNRFNHEPTRPRKLLLHSRQIEKLEEGTQAKGLTVVPLKLYLTRGLVKVEIGLCQGKKIHDKRQVQAERSAKREIEREMKKSRR